MTTNEIITELLQYDGYTKDVGTHSITYISEIDNEWYRTVISNEYAQTYLTDLNILHRVAVKVFGEVVDSNLDVSDINDLCCNIENVLLCNPNEQGEHLQLAEALVNAIKYIQNATT